MQWALLQHASALGLFLLPCSKVVKQQAMHKDVAAPYFAQQEAFRRLIEKGDHVPGKVACTPEPEA
jgi:hypothetical protein